MSPARYPPIAEHGVIGNLHTVALISTDGTIDWYCSPRFDSPSMFAALLDADRGGHFALRPADGESQNKQRRHPAPARYLRRAGRLDLPVRQARHAHLSPIVGRHHPHGQLGVRELGPGRRGNLGDPRRTPALHLLAAAVLGRGRAHAADGHRARATDRSGPPRRPGIGSTVRSTSEGGTRSAKRSSSTTTRTFSTRRSC